MSTELKLSDAIKPGLQVEITVDDPTTFTTPWSAFVTYRHILLLGDWPEAVCAENARGSGTYWISLVPRADKPDFLLPMARGSSSFAFNVSINRKRRLCHESWPISSSLLLPLLNWPIAAKAFDEDLHYNITLVLALSVGFSWEQALTIASADQAVDQNLFTKPTEQIAWNSPPGKNEYAQHTPIPMVPLTLGLSLQDYYFHCFSPEKDTRRSPSSNRHPTSRRVGEKGNRPR